MTASNRVPSSEPTAPSTSVSVLLIFLFLGSLIAIFVLDLGHDTYGSLLRETTPTRDTLLDGSFARRADSWFARRSWSMRQLRPYWNESMLGLFRETSGFVVAGERPWLFSEAYIRRLEEEKAALAMKYMLMFIKANRDVAREHGTKLLVLTVPQKWRFHEEKLVGPHVSAERRSLYGRVLEKTRELGVESPDLIEILRDSPESFPPNDTHLTQRGYVRVTRNVIAPFLGVSGDLAQKRLEAVPATPYRHAGNLPELLSIRPESRVGRAYAADDLRFDAPQTADREGCEVVVLGDSYASYHDHLFPRLIGVVSGMTVDARHAGWMSLPEFMKLIREYERTPPAFVIIINTEDRFASL